MVSHNIDRYLSEDINNKLAMALIVIEKQENESFRPVSLSEGDIGYKSKNAKHLKGLIPPETHVWMKSEPHVWPQNKGWFSASFGPYRRFSGGDPKYLDAYHQSPKAAPHISAFGEDVALGGALIWLRDQARPSRKDGKKICDLVQRVVNSDRFLPNNTTLHEINEDEILFKDGAGNLVEIEQLGDGYRSALCITVELIHQLTLAFGIDALTTPDRPDAIIIPGVVLIDEVDAHLHPIWQQHIGFWLTKRFPEMQFLVTTHSPLICQAATTVFKLPRPGSDEEGRFLDDLELARLRYGNILEAYASEAFGKIERSEEGKRKLERLSELERLSWERELTEDERREQQELQAIFIASPVGLGDTVP